MILGRTNNGALLFHSQGKFYYQLRFVLLPFATNLQPVTVVPDITQAIVYCARINDIFCLYLYRRRAFYAGLCSQKAVQNLETHLLSIYI